MAPVFQPGEFAASCGELHRDQTLHPSALGDFSEKSSRDAWHSRCRSLCHEAHSRHDLTIQLPMDCADPRGPHARLALCDLPAAPERAARRQRTRVRGLSEVGASAADYSANRPTIGLTILTKSLHRIAIASRWVPALNTISGSSA